MFKNLKSREKIQKSGNQNEIGINLENRKKSERLKDIRKKPKNRNFSCQI